ncbi:tetratricopeptide repeat protein [Bacillus salitolerans]|uniref:Tetratricopeptide repeat protein n=1 Tax=Bacillus salitolerans TaxID=1437434 RepID=A0ABW4LTP0_9BACI
MNLIEKAVRFLEYGDVEKGLSQLEKLSQSVNDEEKFFIAHSYYQFGFIEEARNLANILLERYPAESEILLLLAEIYIDLDDEEEAIQLLGRVSGTDSEYPRALILLADLYQMQGLDEVAEQKLLQAKTLKPGNPIIMFALGEFYSGRGNYRQSIPYYEAVLKDQKKIGEINVHLRLAECYTAVGRFEEAFTQYETGLEEQIEIDSLFGFACAAYQAEKYKTAIQKLLDLKDLDPQYTPLYLVLGKAYEAEELLDEAMKTVVEGLKLDDYNKELLIFGGKLSMKLGDVEKGKQLLESAYELDNESLEASYLLTRIYMKEESYDKVVPFVEKAIENGDEDPQMIWDLATAKKELEEYSDALNHYRSAYTFFKDKADFLEEYGRFLIDEGLIKEAINVFEEIIKMDQTRYDIEEMLLQLKI